MSSDFIMELIGRYFLTGAIVAAAAILTIFLQTVMLVKKMGDPFRAIDIFEKTLDEISYEKGKKKKSKIRNMLECIGLTIAWPVLVHLILWIYYVRFKPVVKARLMGDEPEAEP